MPEMDGLSKPPQLPEMFQKFALAFKTKSFEFFAEDDSETATKATATGTEEADEFVLLDSAEEEFITNQKVVVIKPDQTHTSLTKSPSRVEPTNTQFIQTIMSSLFATISFFEASYLQLQMAHVPFNEDTAKTADRALVSHLQRLYDVSQLYRNSQKNLDFSYDFPIGSCLESHVQENQSKLRMLETLVDRLQFDIDVKDDQVLVLRQQLDNIQEANLKLTKRLSTNLNSVTDVLLTIRVFGSMLREACRSLHSFTKLLIELMKKAGWDLALAAHSVHPSIDYAKKDHNRYAFLSYVSLIMFEGFDSESFGLGGNGSKLVKNSSLKQLIEHASCNPMELLTKNPKCDFSKFCEKKYQQLVHPTMESSILNYLDGKEVVLLSSWRSLSVFYELFVKMASSIWLLHKLAYSFNPVVEIFQVERGVNFSTVYMEDVTRKCIIPGKCRPKVGFTAIPGFKIGKTVIQAHVYLTGFKCTG